MVLTALFTMTWVVDAAAVTFITACGQPLSKRGETYVLTKDLTSSGGDCLVVGADSITIDLKGHSITGPSDGTGAGIREGDTGWSSTTVRSSTTKPGTIQGFQYGIDLVSSTRSQILNIISTGHATNGMLLGSRVLVKGCTASHNAWYGIEALVYAQVQDSVASANGGGGILVGNSSLLVRNQADNNVNNDFPNSYVSGITAGSRATLGVELCRRQRRVRPHRGAAEPGQLQPFGEQPRHRHGSVLSEHSSQQSLVLEQPGLRDVS